MRKAIIWTVVLVCALLAVSLTGDAGQPTMKPEVDEDGGGGDATAVQVTNFPATQVVDGAVNIKTFPHVVTVQGTVDVGNLPAVQDVAGTVDVGNLPLDATGSIRVSSGSAQRRFLGFTAARFTGDVGIFTLNRACSTEFPETGECTSAEIVERVNPPAMQPATAWVRPGSAAVVFGFFGTTSVTADSVSGLDSTMRGPVNDLVCQGYENPNAIGIVVNEVGQFSVSGCSNSHSVACCGY